MTMNRCYLLLVLTLVILLGLLAAAAAGALGGPHRGDPGDVRLYYIDGVKVPCIVVGHGSSGVAMSCDWHRTENLP